MKPIGTLVVALHLLSYYRAAAQTSDSLASVRGVLIDSLSGKAVPFATVSLMRQRSLVDGTITDSLGHFRLSGFPYGAYSLAFSAVGYRPARTVAWTVTAQSPTVDLGVSVLGQEAKNLQVVTVRGQKPLIEQRVDGFTVNVESLPTIAGSDGADVLRQVPMLVVNPNGGLSIRGSSQVRVFIDGKPSSVYASSVADALKAIPGESIIKVDVITHPSARYDAEGTDGVVLITTRKFRQNPTSGSVGGILGNRSENLLGDVQSRFGKWLVKADGFYQTYWNRNGSVLERETDRLRVVQTAESRQTGAYFFGGATLLYSIDSLHTLNAGYRARWMINQVHTVSDNVYLSPDRIRPTFQRTIDTPTGSDGGTLVLGYTGSSKDKRDEFSLLGTYGLLRERNQYALAQTGGEPVRYSENFDGKNRIYDLLIQADYSHAFGKSGKWETGGKLTNRTLQSNNVFGIYDDDRFVYRPDPVRSNDFSYQSRIYALYTTVTFPLKNWSLVIGTRYEKTDLSAVLRGTSLRLPSFDNLVPNVLINRKIDQNRALKLGYTLKLVRPALINLNPTVNNSDSLNISFGNPYLRPAVTQRYQFSYSRSSTRLFTDITPFYSHSQNSIEPVRRARADGVFETTWLNIGRNQRLGLSASLNWKPSLNLGLGTTLTVQQVHVASPAINLTNQSLTRELSLTGSYRFANGYSLEVYGYLGANTILLQGYRSGWKQYSLMLNKKSANERLNLSLRLDTVFPRYQFIDEEITTDSFSQHQRSRFQHQNVRLTFSYKLGKKEIKSPRMRQTENPD